MARSLQQVYNFIEEMCYPYGSIFSFSMKNKVSTRFEFSGQGIRLWIFGMIMCGTSLVIIPLFKIQIVSFSDLMGNIGQLSLKCMSKSKSIHQTCTQRISIFNKISQSTLYFRPTGKICLFSPKCKVNHFFGPSAPNHICFSGTRTY